MEFDKRYSEKKTVYYGQAREEILDFIPQKVQRTLDVGCSGGNFSNLLLERNICEEAHGIEPFEEAYLQAKEKLQKVYFSTVEEALPKIENNYYDLIFFNDVLEHLINPDEILKNFKSKLKDDGHIICSIPNVRFIKNLYTTVINKDWEYVDSGVLDKTHLRFFTKKSMLRMFNHCGYEVVSCKGNEVGKMEFGKKIKLLNFFLKGALNDCEYQQFISVLKKK